MAVIGGICALNLMLGMIEGVALRELDVEIDACSKPRRARL
jgi:hypothetical protein